MASGHIGLARSYPYADAYTRDEAIGIFQDFGIKSRSIDGKPGWAARGAPTPFSTTDVFWAPLLAASANVRSSNSTALKRTGSLPPIYGLTSAD
jgi:hypothetical protein